MTPALIFFAVSIDEMAEAGFLLTITVTPAARPVLPTFALLPSLVQCVASSSSLSPRARGRGLVVGTERGAVAQSAESFGGPSSLVFGSRAPLSPPLSSGRSGKEVFLRVRDTGKFRGSNPPRSQRPSFSLPVMTGSWTHERSIVKS